MLRYKLFNFFIPTRIIYVHDVPVLYFMKTYYIIHCNILLLYICIIILLRENRLEIDKFLHDIMQTVLQAYTLDFEILI